MQHVMDTLGTFAGQLQRQEPAAMAGLAVVVAIVVVSGWMLVNILTDDKPRLDGAVKYEEYKICTVDDLPSAGSMKPFRAGKSDKVLIVRTSDGVLTAFPNKCTHYPLELAHAGGVLAGDRIVCPFHASCFNAETGDVEDGPGFDSLPVYETRIQGNDFFVRLPKDRRGKLVTRRKPCRHRVGPPATIKGHDVVVIGTGAAAAGAIETLLQEGHAGSITVVSKETTGLWDRVKVSKSISKTDYSRKNVFIEPSEWEEKGVRLLLGHEVTIVDAERRIVSAVSLDGSRGAGEAVDVPYDRLICCSGGPARTFRADKDEPFTIDGADLGNIFTLRNAQDNGQVVDALDGMEDSEEAARVVVVGSSFIGMEAAASLLQFAEEGKVRSIDIVGMENEPFERVLGTELGAVMRRLHEEKAAALDAELARASGGMRADGEPHFRLTFHMSSVTTRFTGDVGVVTGVEVADAFPRGSPPRAVLDADIVIIGSGMIPAVSYLNDTPAVVQGPGAPRDVSGVRVDECLRACEGVWCAGDIAQLPNTRFQTCERDAFIRIEHWDTAIDQGRCAARNVMRDLAGQEQEPFDVVPFFWTQQHGHNLRYAGHAHFVSSENTIIRGDTSAKKPSLVAYFCHENQVLAVATLNADPQAAAAQELFRRGAMPSRHAIEGSAELDLAKALAGLR